MIAHELYRMYKEIQLWIPSKPEYAKLMMYHLNNMCILTFLEFTKKEKIPKANLQMIHDLLILCRRTMK
jgi:hypothetical protein